MNMQNLDFIRDGILGLIAADAVGVPAEFRERNALRNDPITDMTEYGTHYQPRGTWSDDSSMTLCTVDSLCNGYDLNDMMEKFCDWLYDAEYTPWGTVFDSGLIVRKALWNYRDGKPALQCGGRDIRSNGNGSLMRILPIVCYERVHQGNSEAHDRRLMIDLVHQASALTHAHPVSMIGCGIYAQLINCLVRCRQDNVERGNLQFELQKAIDEIWNDYECEQYGNLYQDKDYADALKYYDRLKDMFELGWLPEWDIRSTGYIVDTLEAALWCLFRTENYRDCVLEAVNLGGDTDTVAAVAGSFAAIYYGTEDIPADWLASIARLEWIEELIARFMQSLGAN